MSTFPKFSLAFGIAGNDEERIKAFEFYRSVFNAVKTGESKPPDGDDLHITMEINGFEILIAPGEEKGMNNIVTCQLQFDNEKDLCKAYDILIQEGHDYSMGSYPWAKLGAYVKDKYGVGWWLFTS